VSAPYFLDANVVLYAVGRPSAYTEPCRQVLTAIGKGTCRGVADVNIIQEILHVALRKGRLEAGLAAIDALLDIVAVLPVEAADVPAMLDLARSVPGLDAQDAPHLAVMRRYGISHIITADRRYAGVSDLTVLDPHTAAALLGA
jgi:predicted nucleic acid-binding protein